MSCGQYPCTYAVLSLHDPTVRCPYIVIVNVGNASGEIPFVFGELARKEVDIRSVWRYRNIYPIAIEAVRTGRIDLKHIEPAMFPFEKSQEAFEYAFEHRSEVLKTIIQVTE